jgi:hypothetical protein
VNSQALTIVTTSLPTGTAGIPYLQSVTATGGTGAYHWSATGLPSGLSINSNTGAIAGTPAAPSTGTVVVTVNDSATPTPRTANKDLIADGESCSAARAHCHHEFPASSDRRCAVCHDSVCLGRNAALYLVAGFGIGAAVGCRIEFQFTLRVSDTASASAAQTLNLTVVLPTLSINGGSNSAEVAPSSNVSMSFNLYDEANGANDIAWAQFYLEDSSGNAYCYGDLGAAQRPRSV